MSESIADFLKARAERSFRKFLEEAEKFSQEEALRDRHPNWPGQEWGIGQNGSVAGIVYHVAAWKQMTLPLFQPGGIAINQEDFDIEAAPSFEDWQGLMAWLKQVGMAWNTELALLPESSFAETREWSGMTLPLSKIITHVYEHDIQHTAQLEYLSQRNLSLLSEN